ncbi:hypothetical protein B0H10DRAFT_218133 [Mycena sp. CBHHK59/15]|nr:hypothetical protein B0H10DRAFT_218133 [Mycena sp. CBHHK59/15]
MSWTTIGHGELGTFAWLHRAHGTCRFSFNDITANGRVASPRCRCDLYLEDESAKSNAHAWLAQANHVLGALAVTEKLHSYVLIDEIICFIYFGWEGKSPAKRFTQDVYLFACPVELCSQMGLRLAPESHQVFWSLDPLGEERLSQADADAMGLPTLEFYAKVMGVGWQAYHYDGLLNFHRSKGFDPQSQDVARHMDYPLLEVSQCTVVDGSETDYFSDAITAREPSASSLDDSSDQATVVDIDSKVLEVDTMKAFCVGCDARVSVVSTEKTADAQLARPSSPPAAWTTLEILATTQMLLFCLILPFLVAHFLSGSLSVN